MISKCMQSLVERVYAGLSGMSDCQESIQQVVMVADDDVAMLVDEGSCVAPASELNRVCKTQPYVDPFDDMAAGQEYAEDEIQQESLCLMNDVADSYEDRPMIAVDTVSVVCDEQKEESECCNVKEFSSTHDQVFDHNGQMLLLTASYRYSVHFVPVNSRFPEIQMNAIFIMRLCAKHGGGLAQLVATLVRSPKLLYAGPG